MARLFLIRHGEPEAQWGGVHDDPGLSERGRQQAAEAGQTLAREGPLALRSSPMRRCRETMAPYLQLMGCSEAELDPRFGEVATPPGVGDRRVWLMENFPWRAGSAARDWRAMAPDLRSWRERVLSAAAAIGQDTAVFTHFIATNVIVGAAMERTQTIVFRPDYASISELDVRDGLIRVRRLGQEMAEGEVR